MTHTQKNIHVILIKILLIEKKIFLLWQNFIPKVWFQNQRAKVKKIQKKAKLDGSHPKGTSDSPDSQESDNSNMTKIKDEAHSDTESLMDSPYATASSADTMSKLRTCIKDENDGTPYNCIETNKGGYTYQSKSQYCIYPLPRSNRCMW